MEGRVKILDGSTGHLLIVQHGLPEDDVFKKIWSASALLKEEFHDKIKEVHKSYLKVGSEILTTNSYAIQPYYYRRGERLIREILDEKDHRSLEDIMSDHAKLSAELAINAREEFFQDAQNAKNHDKNIVKVFGSLGPICESHRPELFKEFLESEGEKGVTNHFRAMAQALLYGGCDGLLLETMNSWKEACLALDGAAQAIAALEMTQKNIPIMVSLQGNLLDSDDLLNPKSKEKAILVARQVIDHKASSGINITVLGFNCVEPENILAALETIRNHHGGQLMEELRSCGIELAAYANVLDMSPLQSTGGYQTHEDFNEFDLKRQSDTVTFAKRFAEAGATYIGSCCGSNPDDVAAINKLLQN